VTESEPPVYTLMVDLGRTPDDGLPEDCDGAAMLCYCAAATEKAAVDETVRVLREAGMSPVEVESHGTLAERAAAGHPIPEEDRALMRRAVEENAVIVAQVLPFTDDEETPAPDADA